MTLPSLFEELRRTLHRGPSHDDRLAGTAQTIVVSGTRGKSAATRWLYEILYSRGADVFAKITGNQPLALYDGETHEIERSRRVTLYENESQLRKYAPVETVILENQGIGEYTTRLVNERFSDPDVVFLTNVRRDHLDQLGRNPLQIGRAFARTIPNGTTVVIGEQREEIWSVLRAGLSGRGISARHVSVPREAAGVPGAETIYGLNEVLAAIGAEQLSDNRLAAYLDEMRVEWTQLPRGKVYNAASVNDVDSTEIIRQALDLPDHETIQPLLYLRADRRARTVSFLKYLDELYQDDQFELARAVGPHAELFSRHASFPVAVHDESESPAAVLDAALKPGWPVFIAGNTVADFMRDLTAEIERRETERSAPEQSRTHVSSDDHPEETL